MNGQLSAGSQRGLCSLCSRSRARQTSRPSSWSPDAPRASMLRALRRPACFDAPRAATSRVRRCSEGYDAPRALMFGGPRRPTCFDTSRASTPRAPMLRHLRRSEGFDAPKAATLRALRCDARHASLLRLLRRSEGSWHLHFRRFRRSGQLGIGLLK